MVPSKTSHKKACIHDKTYQLRLLPYSDLLNTELSIEYHSQQEPSPMKKYYTNSLPKFALNFLVLILRIFGLFPFRFNESKKRFNMSISLFIYSIVALVAYVYFIGLYYWTTLWSVLSQPTRYNVVLLFVSLVAAYCGVLVNKLTILVFASEFQRLLNDFYRLWISLHIGCDGNRDRKLLNRFLFKMIVIDQGWVHFYNALYTAFNFSVEAIVANLIIAVAYLGGHYFRMINLKIVRLHQKWNTLERGQTYSKLNSEGKRHLCEKISIELSRLMIGHEKVNRTILKFMQLHDASMVLIQLKNFVVIIMGVFIACVTTVNDIRRNRTPSFGIYGYLAVLSVFHFIQFYYLMASASLFTKRGDKTGQIVDFMIAREHDDELDVKIHAFSMELLHRDNKIYSFGLFPIDFSLLYVSLGSMANYLIVSIQLQIQEFE
uniref:gustatory receptor 47 n=1 Tax=Aedes aegypti TaxID=7159 RepID=UPI000C2C8781|nr:gustatory receptor 47 [Aedes aegypti]